MHLIFQYLKYLDTLLDTLVPGTVSYTKPAL